MRLKYLDDIKLLKTKGQAQSRKINRPNIPLFADLILQSTRKFPIVVFDEVNAIENTTSLTFRAALQMRDNAETIILLSGSPTDNISWYNIATRY